MKKAMKKLMAALLAVAMVCAMAIPAFAAGGAGATTGEGKITINNAVIGHTYKIYRILNFSTMILLSPSAMKKMISGELLLRIRRPIYLLIPRPVLLLGQTLITQIMALLSRHLQ